MVTITNGNLSTANDCCVAPALNQTSSGAGFGGGLLVTAGGGRRHASCEQQEEITAKILTMAATEALRSSAVPTYEPGFRLRNLCCIASHSRPVAA
jgi:hypothetical protein